MCSTSRCLVAAVVVAQFAAQLVLLAEGRLSPMSSGMDSGMGSGTNNLPTSDPITPPCYDEDVRLENTIYSVTAEGFDFVGGRVEVCQNGMYGAICDIGWNSRAAQAACDRAGYTDRVGVPTFGSYFGAYNGSILYQNITCSDSYNCTALNATDSACNSSRIAGVMCVYEPTPSPPCYDGEVRLENMNYSYVDGDNVYGGRVAVCYNGTYHPVCDDEWTDSDAAVVCYTVGYSSSNYRYEATRRSEFGRSDERPVLQNLMCSGSEYSLSDCPGYNLNNVTGDYCLSGDYQAGVRCIEEPTPSPPCYDGEVRLENMNYSYVDGDNVYGGRVAVCYNGTYHPVCDDEWTDSDAAVVCYIVGYSSSNYRYEATRRSEFGRSDERPVLQNLMCSGSEYSLSDCPGYNLNNVTGDYCLSGDYQAGVRCIEVTPQCYDEDIRLENTIYSVTAEGFDFVGGRVEVCQNGMYGAICDIGWNNRAAQAACDRAGYTDRVGVPTFGSFFGAYNGSIFYQNVTCSDSYNCTALNATDSACNSTRIAGVMCVYEPRPCTEGDVILTNDTSGIYEGTDFSGGRVEVCVNGTYRPVCDRYWSNEDANVVCNNQYDRPNYRGQATGNSTFGLSNQQPVILRANCSGTEYDLRDCDNYTISEATTDYCLGGQYQAGVRCLEVVRECFNNGDIEFSNYIYDGETEEFVYSFEARVDYCLNRTLGAVCDVGWSDEDAVVACRRNGQNLLGEAISGLPYGPRVPVVDNVMCNGSEAVLDQCLTLPPGQVSQECTESSSRAAGVRCYQVCYDGNVRLVGGSNTAMGRVEVCSNNTWGTVCDLGWDNRDAVPACMSAGFYWGGEIIPNTEFGVGSGPILASNISCNGSEYDLSRCYNTTDIPSVCTHERDAALSCQPGFIDMNIAIDGSTELAEGNTVTLWCNAQSDSVANLTSYTWRNSRGVVVSDGGRINITLHNGSYIGYYGQFIFNSSLTFSPLWPSDGDRYVCELTIALPRVGVNITNTTSFDLRIRVQPPAINVSYTTPFVNSSFAATCMAQFSPGVQISLDWVPIGDAPPFDSASTVNEGSTMRVIESVLESVELNDNLRYVCIADVISGDYVYAPSAANRSISLTPILAPTFIREVVDQNIVINSSTARSVGNSGQTANFVCIVDSQPLANITWSYESFADSRISIMTDRLIQERQVSVLTLFAVQFGDQGQFICNAISPYGSISSTADLNIFVIPDDVRVEAISGILLTEGDMIALNCSIDGSWPAPTQIQWLRNGIPVLSSTDRISINTSAPYIDSYGLYLQSSNLIISDTHPVEDSGVYTCKIFLRSPGVPTVSGDISITIQARNECVLATDPLVTPCVNGFCVDGFNTYTCLCYDGYTGRNCDVEVITRTPPSLMDPPLPTTGRAGQAINLTCTVSGVPTPSVTWFSDGVLIEGAIFQFLYFPSVTPQDRGSYYCVAENSEGRVQSDEALLTLEGIQQFSAALMFPSRTKRQDTPSPINDLANQLIGQTLGDSGVTIYSVSVVGEADLLITVAAEGEFPPGGVGGALSDQITATAEAAGIEVTVLVTRFDGCPMERGPPYLPYYPTLRITWPELEIGQTATESCPCGSLNTSEINYQATRTCGGDYSSGAVWRPQDATLCSFSNTTLQLCQVTELAVEEQAGAVADIVSDPTLVDADSFSVAAEIMTDLLSDVDIINTPEFVNTVLMSVDDLLDVDATTTRESQEQSGSNNMLLDAIEDFTGNVQIPPGQSTISFPQDNFALFAEETDPDDFAGLTFSTDSRDNFDNGRIGTSLGSSVPGDSIAAIILPPSILDDDTSTLRRFSFAVYADDTLFQSRGESQRFEGLQVGSVIVSATLHGVTVSDLTEPVTIQFGKAMRNAPSICVFWDPAQDGGFGAYSTDGCTTDDREETVTCSCDHLTSFTILSNDTAIATRPVTQPPPTTEETESDDDSDHNAVVFLLLSISLVLLLLTITVQLGLRVLRETYEGKILVNFAASLAALYFVTMLAYGEDMPKGACRLWAFLMVYFFIVALVWSFAEALLLVLRLKMTSFGEGFLTRNYVWIAIPIAWVAPLVPALISLGGLDYYNEYRLCQVYNWPFYAFLVAPLILFYSFNWLFYVATLVTITHMSTIPQGAKDTPRSTFYHIFAAMLLSLVYGLGWAFGFVASSDVSRDGYLTTQYLFSFLILTHAVLQFIFYLPPREELRRLWYIATRRTQEYRVSGTTESGNRSNKYLASSSADKYVEAIGLVESGRSSSEKKQPAGDTTTVDTAPLNGQTTETPKPAIGAANQLADDKDAATSYTNKEAIEAADDEKPPISSL